MGKILIKSANITLMTKVTNLRNTVQTQFKISVYRILVGTAIVIGQTHIIHFRDTHLKSMEFLNRGF